MVMMSKRDEVVLAAVREGAYHVFSVLEATDGVPGGPLTAVGARESLDALTEAGHIRRVGSEDSMRFAEWEMNYGPRSAEFEVRRIRGGGMYGPFGQASYYSEARPGVGSLPSPEAILGRP